jgi:hypothetical protein
MLFRLALVSLSAFISASPAFAQQSSGQGTGISLLQTYCGYTLGAPIIKTIAHENVNKSEMAASIVFALQLYPKKRTVLADLSFGCATPSGKKASVQFDLDRTSKMRIPRTARDEVRAEDSGGRYCRIITWQKVYRAENFNGTIAYINSIFGDGIKTASPEYFLVCPESDDMTCFSLEVRNKIRLTQIERKAIAKLLSKISHSD